MLNKVKRALSVFSFLEIKKYFLSKNKKNANQPKQNELDKKLVYSFSKSRIPNLKQLKYIKKFLSKKEAWALNLSFLIFAVCLVFLGVRFYVSHLELSPIEGGEYTEGLVGSPKYINPLYSVFSDIDGDISSLIFSSIFKRNKDGRLTNDLAESYQVEGDNKIYIFKIRKDAKWHNGASLAVDDIVFTFNIIKDASYQSTLRESFNGVEIEKIDDVTIKFILAEPYAAFPELLTFGILPEDLWYKIPPVSAGLAELNLKPIGSGPYKFKSLKKDKNGPVIIYSLAANEDYYGEKPKISSINFEFFPNFEEAVAALNKGEIDGISYLPDSLKKDLIAKNSLNVYKLNLPQIIVIFFNKKNNAFLEDKLVRQALAMSINKNEIIEKVKGGDARAVDGPILPDNFAYNKNNKNYQYNKEEAGRILEQAGWKSAEITADDMKKAEENKNDKVEEKKKEAENILSTGIGKWRRKGNNFLAIKLTLPETEENIKLAELIKNYWLDLGVKTEIKLVDAGQVKLSIIRQRDFEALIYSQIVGYDPDLYAFWHSSQAGESGFNLSNYNNKEVDQLLEEARVASDIESRKNKYIKFQEIITEETPAVFLYSPIYTYAQSKKVKGFDIKNILSPYDRFANINEWYIKEGKRIKWN